MGNSCSWKEYTTIDEQDKKGYFYVIGCNKTIFAMDTHTNCDFKFCPYCGKKIKMGYVGCTIQLTTDVYLIKS